MTLYNTDNTISTNSTDMGTMLLINLEGSGSICEQISDQIAKYIDLGILKPDDKLPSVRALAQDLNINPNTVMKAYQQLERDGLICSLSKKGIFVARNIKIQKHPDRSGAIVVIDNLKGMGFSKSDLIDVLNEVYMDNR